MVYRASRSLEEYIEWQRGNKTRQFVPEDLIKSEQLGVGKRRALCTFMAIAMFASHDIHDMTHGYRHSQAPTGSIAIQK